MPRPTKAFKRQRTSAAAAYKRGEKAEAYKLWAEASASLKAHRDKKVNKNKKAAEAKAAEAAASAAAESGDSAS